MKAYQLRIELLGTKKPVYRRFIIPHEITFKRFHDVIQCAMGWRNEHLYEFSFPNDDMIITSNLDLIEEYNYYKENLDTIKLNTHVESVLKHPVKSVTLKCDKFLMKHKKMNYLYDFGDTWYHEITLEKVIEDYPYVFPTCLEYVGACPPEGIGGPDGYEYFLNVLEDEDHPEYNYFSQYAKEMDYVDDEVNLEELNACIKDIFRLKRLK